LSIHWLINDPKLIEDFPMIGALPLLAIYLTRHATYSAILVEEKKVWKTLLPQPQLDLSLEHRSGACSSPCDLPRHSPLLRERKELFPVARPYKGQTSIVSLPASKPPTTPTIQYAATRSEPALDYLQYVLALRSYFAHSAHSDSLWKMTAS
jgi:hypothetical protein